ncbi:MAG: Trm112 family protein [Planctomycetota bacterium]
MIHPDLLAILACPASRQPLAEADADLLGRVNERIAAGGVQNVGGEDVTKALQAALVREDGTLVYPVRDDIPVLLREEGIEVASGDA